MLNELKRSVLERMGFVYGLRRTTAISQRWRLALNDPELISDIATLGHLFEPDIDPDTGALMAPDKLIERAAHKSFALQLLARAGISHEDLLELRNRKVSYDDQTEPYAD